MVRAPARRASRHQRRDKITQENRTFLTLLTLRYLDNSTFELET